MPETKPFWKSKTIMAALGVAIVAVAPHLGINLTQAESAEAQTAVQSILLGIGSLVVIYGRAKARTKITLKD